MRFSALSFCTLLATTALAQPAFAQFAGAPPVRESIDGNGVDLFLGTYNVDSPSTSMGNADNGLAYKWYWRGGGWADTANSLLYKSGTTLTASIGTTTDRFTLSGSTYTPTEGNGSSLSYNSGTSIYTYTTADGTVVHFNKAMAAQTYSNTEGIITDMTRRQAGNIPIASRARSTAPRPSQPTPRSASAKRPPTASQPSGTASATSSHSHISMPTSSIGRRSICRIGARGRAG